MINNKPYWINKVDQAKKAAEHVEETNKYPLGESVIYDDSKLSSCPNKNETKSYGRQKCFAMNSVDALYKIDAPGKKVAILNFASYTNPGGMFLAGSSAQEESLCHESNLYQNLKANQEFYDYNKSHKNRGLYSNRAIYTRDVCFIRDDILKKCDVITCAAPNLSAFSYNKIIDSDLMSSSKMQENELALKSRCDFIRRICDTEHVDKVILGAWGCGVFKQDPEMVAAFLKEAFKDSKIDCIYAVPLGFHKENYKAFSEIINNWSKDAEQERGD